MPTIAANTYRLPIAQKLARGQTIITKSTDNPNVPGNATVLATLSAAQEALAAANADFEAIQLLAKQRLAVRDAALAVWNASINSLAAFTECATGSDPAKILSAGFDVRSAKTPQRPVQQIINVQVSYTGNPGYSEVLWKRDPDADAYRVQRSPEVITETSWEEVGTVTEAKYGGNGATPGQKCWYRIAGINRLGQGPWSEPALRPVM